MRIEIVLADDIIARYAEALAQVPEKAPVEVRRGLSDGGRKATTKVRRALKQQMNVRRYGVIVQATNGYLSNGGMAWTIQAYGKGLPIREFKTKVYGKGIYSDPWGVGRVFARSFQQRLRGGLRARTTDKRFPIRSLYGPSPSKELVKDDALSTWEGEVNTIQEAVLKRLGKLLPG